jgi:exodeoxyribonuclease VII small subunit
MTAAPAKKTKKKTPDFEEALSELEGITKRLERGDLALDEALACFENGIGLLRSCDTHLKGARGRLMELTKGESGEFITKVLGESLESFIGGGNTDG